MTTPGPKIINGVEYPLSPDEVAEWEANLAAEAALAPERLKADILAKTEALLNAFARSRNYDSILSACTYATSTVPKFAAEGQYCVELRDNTWATLYTMLSEVEGGTRQIPGSFDDIAGELPTATAEWPD